MSGYLQQTLVGIGHSNSALNDPAAQVAAARKRKLIPTITFCSAIPGAAFNIDFAKGA